MGVEPVRREKIIRDFMEAYGYTRQEAEDAAAIELGESPGDVIEETGDDDNE